MADNELKSMALDDLRKHAGDIQKTADWMQSMAAEAQRAAVMARREIQRRKGDESTRNPAQ
jgi:hypothetical protein